MMSHFHCETDMTTWLLCATNINKRNSNSIVFIQIELLISQILNVSIYIDSLEFSHILKKRKDTSSKEVIKSMKSKKSQSSYEYKNTWMTHEIRQTEINSRTPQVPFKLGVKSSDLEGSGIILLF